MVNPRGTTRRETLLAAGCSVLLVLWSLATYADVLSHSFVNWDDDKYLTENTHFRGLGLEQLHWMWSGPYMGHYHPVTWMSYAIDHSFWGMNPKGYLLTNLLLHVTSGLALYWLCRRLRPHLLATACPACWSLFSALAVAVFLVHPLRAETVAWASNRKDLLAALFALLSMTVYVFACGQESGRKRWLAISGSLFLLSLLSKASATLLPILLCLLDVYPLRRIGPRPWAERGKLLDLLKEKWLHWSAMALALVFAPLAQKECGATLSMFDHGPMDRVIQLFYCLAYYPIKTLWPTDLCCLYLLPPRFDPLEGRFLWSIVLVAAAAAACVRFGRRWPGAVVCLAAYALLILPVSGLAQAGVQLVADRYSYFPAMVFTIAAAVLLVRGYERFRASPARLTLAGLFTVAVLGMLHMECRQQLTTWKNGVTLWTHAFTVEPDNFVACHNLGSAYFAKGELHRAESLYRKTVAMAPTFSEGLLNLGGMEVAGGRPEQGIALYRRALEQDPNKVELLYNLANVLTTLGRTEESLPYYERAASIDSENYRVRANFARALLISNRYFEAADHYLAATLLDANQAIAWEGLGSALLQSGQPELAIEPLSRACRLPDASPLASLLLERAELDLGRHSKTPAPSGPLRIASEANMDGTGAR